MTRIHSTLLLVGLLASPPACTAAEELLPQQSVDFFEKRIRPTLVNHCYDCHGPDEASGKLRLDSKAGWMRGGETGPAIVAGDPTASLLYRAVTHQDKKLKMPPPDEGEKLSDQQIADLATWIRNGAIDPRTGGTVAGRFATQAKQHWAFQPVAPPRIELSSHPVDYLVEKQLRQRGFVATAQADMRMLIRRATYDLHGLPPTPEQLKTPREQFGQLVDALLASPRYGERWGRHWLDVARYSDAKDGVLMYGDARIRPFAYTYRDYVIRALNEDKPFDQFVREQLAADQLALPADSPDLAAQGLLTLGRMFDNNVHDVVDDRIDVVTRAFLGLTVSCARCHDHKFDPIPTADYYSLYGVFASCVEPYDRPRIAPPSDQAAAHEKELAAKLAEVLRVREQHYQQLLKTARQRTPDYLVQVATTEPDIAETTYFFLSLLPDQLRPHITYRWRKLIARRAHPDDPVFGPWYDLMQEPTLRTESWRDRGVDQRVLDGLAAAKPKTPAEVARSYGEIIRRVWQETIDGKLKNAAADPLAGLLLSQDSPTWFPIDGIFHYLSRKDKDAFRGLVNQLDAISVKHKAAAPRAMALLDSESLCDPVIFQRGDPGLRGTPVPRQFLEVLSQGERKRFAHGSGRLDLAKAIGSPDNPLTARVWVNRVWMHHFGEPLVENPSDFGLRTKRPQQHELLDYLAAELIKSGWRTKPLHKLIMTSKTYQRASQIPATPRMAEQLQADPANRFLWHAGRRRLDLEQMRDTMLVVSGKIDFTMYGRPSLITDANNRRRTVYAFVERQNLPSIVQTFDFANADTSTARRGVTTVPQQALFVMNSDFVMRSAAALATRIQNAPPKERIEKLYNAVLSRRPSAEEVEVGANFIEANSWQRYAQVLLMTNEFMFVD